MDRRNFLHSQPATAPLNPFTWSLRRREMLDRCAREYFLHYYGSVGGAFLKINSRQSEQLHLLRSILPAPKYVRHLLYGAVRSLFISGALEAGDFKKVLEEQFIREFRDMLLGKAEQDHKRPFLQELTCPGFSPQTLKEQLLENLRQEAAKVEENALKQLLSVPPEKRLELPFPLKIRWCELDTYCTVIAAWLDSGHFNALCTGSASEENSALLSFYALNRYGCDPNRVTVLHLEEGKLSEAPRYLSFSGAFRRIRSDVDTMLDLESRSGGTDSRFFPQEFHNCEQCRFNLFCSGKR